MRNTNKTRSPSAMDDGSRSFTEMNRRAFVNEPRKYRQSINGYCGVVKERGYST
jgi:hypothetical protein